MPRTLRPLARALAPQLREALADTPAVLIHGPRQRGKTTLARLVGEPRGYPPDKPEKATQTVLEQAEVLSAEWLAA